MSKYYLVAKSKTDNRFEIVKIRGNEISCNGTSDLERSFNLEKIDLFTSIFHSEEELLKYLKNKGRINLDDCELFIAARNGDTIKYLNCMYHFSDRVDLLRQIMISSDKKELTKDSVDATQLLNDFIYNVFHNERFYNLVVNGYTDIYKKFIDYFKRCSAGMKEYGYSKYSDGRWAMTSYILQRSIMDAYNIYNQTYKSRYMLNDAASLKRNNRNSRESITNELKLITDKDYVEGQISMFDTEYLLADTKVSRDESVTVKSSSELSRSDKLIEVLTYLDRFPRTMFVGENLEFSSKIFPGCDVSKLNNLSKKLKNLINSYSVVNYHYAKALEYQGNSMQLAEDLDGYKKDIKKLLAKDAILDKFYNFCILYGKIKEEYEMKVTEGKVYGKRNSNQ